MHDDRDLLEQQLWELLYDLLPEGEADALRQQIASDPVTAEVFARVRRQQSSLAAALKWDGDDVALTPPAEESQRPMALEGRDHTDQVAQETHPSDSDAMPRGGFDLPRAVRMLNGLAALAAAVLLAVLGYAWVRPESLLRSQTGLSLLDELAPVRIVVTGPRRISTEGSERFTISTTALTGEPEPRALEWQFLDENGRSLRRGVATTDADGFAVVEPPVELAGAGRLEVATAGDKAFPVVALFESAPAAYVTSFFLPKSVYEPGEVVRFRSLTMSALELSPLDGTPIHYQLLAPNGEAVAEMETVAENGVAAGEVTLPNDQPEGEYAIVMRSENPAVPEQRRPLEVRREPRSEDSRFLGRGTLAFGLESGKAADQRPDVYLAFYPEGGKLVAGLENRVFLQALTPAGAPIAIRGTLVDDQGRENAEAATDENGRGVFRITPQTQRRYRLMLKTPALATEPITLPPSDEADVLLHAGDGMISAGAPLTVELTTTRLDVPLVVAVTCRGELVGQADIALPASRDGSGPVTQTVTAPLADNAAGLLLVTVYDYSQAPPHALAERWVYRHPARFLEVEMTAAREPAAENTLRFDLHVTDESGRPTPAVLGLALVEDQILPPQPANSFLAKRFLFGSPLASEDRGAKKDAYFFQQQPNDAEIALVLGTLPLPHHFEEPPVSLLADATANRKERSDERGRRLNESLALSDRHHEATLAGEPLAFAAKSMSEALQVVDNFDQVRAAAEAQTKALHQRQETLATTLGRVGLAGGALLLVVLMLTGLMRVGFDGRVWAPALACSLLLLGIGGAWLSGAPRASVSHDLVAFHADASKAPKSAVSRFSTINGVASTSGGFGGVASPRPLAVESEAPAQESAKPAAVKAEPILDLDQLVRDEAPADAPSEDAPSPPQAEARLRAKQQGGAPALPRAAAPASNAARAEALGAIPPAAGASAPLESAAPAGIPFQYGMRSRQGGARVHMSEGDQAEAFQEAQSDKELAESRNFQHEKLALPSKNLADDRQASLPANLGGLPAAGVQNERGQMAVIYWEPKLSTDTQGRASIAVPGPQTGGPKVLRVEAHSPGRVYAGQWVVDVPPP